jgi:C1A family cysteine protease
MRLGTTRRVVASLLLGSMATALAACGIASGPVMPMATGPASALARATPDTPRKFGLTFDAQTPKVTFVPGTIASNLPPTADLRSKLSPVDDQGLVGACTGFTMVGLAEYRARLKGNTEELSPGFIYLMNLKEDGNLGQDAGSRISTSIKVLQKYGTCPEALHPFLAPTAQQDPANIASYLNTIPSAAAVKAAAANKIGSYRPVRDLNGFKTALAKGLPVAFGVAVYKSFMGPEAKATGIIPMPAGNDELLGGHAILAVGYDDAKKQVVFRNSWSPKWGDQGYGYLPYDYFKKDLAGDAWVAN